MQKLEQEQMMEIEGGGFDMVGVIFETVISPPSPQPLSAGDETVGTLP